MGDHVAFEEGAVVLDEPLLNIKDVAVLSSGVTWVTRNVSLTRRREPMKDQ